MVGLSYHMVKLGMQGYQISGREYFLGFILEEMKEHQNFNEKVEAQLMHAVEQQVSCGNPDHRQRLCSWSLLNLSRQAEPDARTLRNAPPAHSLNEGYQIPAAPHRNPILVTPATPDRLRRPALFFTNYCLQ